jgi:hypothetical protein
VYKACCFLEATHTTLISTATGTNSNMKVILSYCTNDEGSYDYRHSDVLLEGYREVPNSISVYALVDVLIGSQCLNNKYVNAALYTLSCNSLAGFDKHVNRDALIKEVFLQKMEEVDEGLDFSKFVQYETDPFWASKAAAFYLQIRRINGQASISLKDELEDLQVMDVFLHAYVKGRQEARRDWYKQNPAVYAADLKNHNWEHNASRRDDETI